MLHYITISMAQLPTKDHPLKSLSALRVLLTLLVFYLCACTPDSGSDNAEHHELPSVTVDEVYARPAAYTEPVRMIGKVVGGDPAGSIVLLGCADACVMLPVRYRGEPPERGTTATAVGKVSKVDGKFVFEAEEVR